MSYQDYYLGTEYTTAKFGPIELVSDNTTEGG
jgi:hypothetical protein